jgi:tetratricopeptide (TPR) repeat protein
VRAPAGRRRGRTTNEAAPATPAVHAAWTSPRFLVGSFLVLSVVALYWPVRTFEFVDLDDDVYVTANPHVKAGLTAAGVRWAFLSTDAALWHPLTWISHMVDCELFGLAGGGHHLTSLALHAANTLLVFVLFLGMTNALWRSAIVASLFGLHPLRVESVAWVAERKDVLSGLFFLLLLRAYVHHVRRPTPRRFATVAALLAAGLLAKPMLVTAPFVLLLVDYWPLSRFETVRLRALLAEKAPLLGIAAGVALLTVVAGHDTLASISDLPVPSRAANALVACAGYLGKTFSPTALAVFYPMPESRPAGTIIGAGLLFAALTAFAVGLGRRFPYLPVGWLWFVGMLLPVSGILQSGQQAMADRFTYLPSIGVLVALVWGLAEICRRWPIPPLFITSGAVAARGILAASTHAQLMYWRDSTALFNHALAVTSPNSLAHNNLGRRLLLQGQIDNAVAHFRAALEIRPNYPEALNNLGDALLRQGHVDEAASEFAAALSIRPGDPLATYNLGTVLALQGRLDAATDRFRAALRLRPDYADAHYNLGAALALRGNASEAMAQFQQTIECDPEYAKAYLAIGQLLIRQGRALEGLRPLTEALRLDPLLADAHFLLARILSMQGRDAEAANQYREATRLKPELAARIPRAPGS